jgi:EmrB/QacA subfamily drug resistance transporter
MSSPNKPLIVPLIVACALFMENLDSTVITTALPQMALTFGTTAVHLNIGVTAYILSLAVFVPVSGWVADRLGGRAVFRAAIGIFTLGSILCGLSNSTEQLIAARVLQGFGGAMMTPVGRLVMLRSIDRSDLARAVSYLTVPAQLGPVMGPVVGGFITTYLSWRWIFFINLPIGLLGMLLVTLYIDNRSEGRRRPLDWLGFLLTGTAAIAVMYGVETIGRRGEDPLLGAVSLVIGLALGTLAVLHFRRAPAPLLDLSLLRVPTFRANFWGGLLFRMSIVTPFLLPIMFQLVFGMSAFVSGLFTFTTAAASLVMKMTAIKVMRRFGFRSVLVWNGFITAMTLLACGFLTPSTPAVMIVAVLLFGGFFRSLQFNTLQTVAYAEVPPAQMSSATTVASMVQQLGNGFGVALAALLLQLALAWRGSSAPDLLDFRFVFAAVTALSLTSILFYLPLAKDAGAEVSGHRPKAAKAEAPAAD